MEISEVRNEINIRLFINHVETRHGTSIRLSNFSILQHVVGIFPVDFQRNRRCIFGRRNHFHGRRIRHRITKTKHLRSFQHIVDFQPKDVLDRPNQLQKSHLKKKYNVFSLKESILLSSLPILVRPQHIFSQSYHLKDE